FRSCRVARMLAISTYQWLLSFHIFLAVVWVGGGITLTILAFFAVKSSLPGRKAEFAREAGWVGQRIFMPSAVLPLLPPLSLIHAGSWKMSRAWLSCGRLGWSASFLLGVLVLTPRAKALDSAIQKDGPDAPSVAIAIDRLLLVARIDLVILTVVVFDMVLKPG